MTTTVDMTFKDLNLPEPILQALEKVGYEKPSPIQAESIPLLLEGARSTRSGTDRDRKDRCVCPAYVGKYRS